MNEPLDISSLALDDQFMILLHKKIMDKAVRSAWTEKTERLSILLRLAALFNRSRTAEFPDLLELKASGRKLTLCLSADWLLANPLTRADLEREQDFLSNSGYRLELVEV